MFENCHTVKELNAERIRLLYTDVSKLEVNRQFNAKRKELLGAVAGFKQLRVLRPAPKETNLINGCSWTGKSLKPNTISITKDGVFG